MTQPPWRPLSDERLAAILVAGEMLCDHDVYCLACEVHECRALLWSLLASRPPLPGGLTREIEALLKRITPGEPI